MRVTVDKAGHETFAGAVDDARKLDVCKLRLDLGLAADGLDVAVGVDDHAAIVNDGQRVLRLTCKHRLVRVADLHDLCDVLQTQ